MSDPVFISVGGGKGGVGKSTLTANLGAVLAKKGFRIGFLDADLAGANLHNFVGVKRPQLGLQDFLAQRITAFPQIACATQIQNSWLISGASDVFGLANPKFAQKQRIISHLKQMPADYIFIDLAAGASNSVSDFYAAFQHGIIVSDSLPTSVENAYAYCKNGVIRGLCRIFGNNKELVAHICRLSDPTNKNGFSTVQEMIAASVKFFPENAATMREWLMVKKHYLVLNMVRDEEDIRIGKRFVEMVKKYLSLSIQYIGYISYDPAFRESVRKSNCVSLENPRIEACFDAIADSLVKLTKR